MGHLLRRQPETVIIAAVRIGVDGRSLVEPSGRGIARYTSTLLDEIGSRLASAGEEWLILVPGGARPLEIAGMQVVRASLPARILYGLAAVAARPRLDRLLGGVDVFWAPAPAPLALSPHVPLVLTLHDLSWQRRSSDFTAYERAWHALARPHALARRATRIIAVSESTRTDAIGEWSLDPQRIVTIREGVRARPAVSAKPLDGRPYLLSVGALEPRKAPEVLVGGYRRARDAGLDADLVIVGEGRLADGLAGTGIRLLGRVADAELERLYAGALALVMPSRLEGFGLPPLEAALHGTPSIVSDLPAFTETLGDAAFRFPVDSETELAQTILEVAADETRRTLVGERAREAALALDPARQAEAVHKLLIGSVRGSSDDLDQPTI